MLIIFYFSFFNLLLELLICCLDESNNFRLFCNNILIDRCDLLEGVKIKEYIVYTIKQSFETNLPL